MWKVSTFLVLLGLPLLVACHEDSEPTSADQGEDGGGSGARDATLFALPDQVVTGNNFKLNVAPGRFPVPNAGSFKNSVVLFSGGLAYVASTDQLALGENLLDLGTDFANLGLGKVFGSLAVADHQTCGIGEESLTDTPEPKTPLGLRFVQETFGFSDLPDDDYIFVRYTVTNPGPVAVSGLRVGQVLDWFLRPERSDDITEFDIAREIAQVTHESNSTVVGQVILSDQPTSYNPLFFPPPTSNAEWFDILAGGIQFPGPFGPTIGNSLALGPVTIGSGQSRPFLFALVGGDDLDDFRANVAAARAKAPVVAAAPVACVGFLEVDVDIKPGSDPNSINVDKPQGSVAVAILSTSQFDARTVDPLSVRFGPGEAAEIHGQGHIEDVAPVDGNPDLVFHFRVGDTELRPGDSEACLFGITFDGVLINGCGPVQTRPIISRGGLVATPIGSFAGGNGQITHLERRPDGGLLANKSVSQNGQRVLELVAIELDGTVSSFATIPTVGPLSISGRGLAGADIDFGPNGVLYGALTNDFAIFRRDPDGSLTYECSGAISTQTVECPGDGAFINPLGMGLLPSGRIVVGSFSDLTFSDGAAIFGDWQEFAGPRTAFAADIVAIDEDHIWVYVGFIVGDRRILEVARGGEVREIASIPVSATTGGGIFGDMIATLQRSAVGAPGNLLLAAGRSLWEINPKNGKVFERLGGFNALNGVAYGGDEKLYVLDVASDGTATVFRVEPGKGK